jgi:hypothetical protein
MCPATVFLVIVEAFFNARQISDKASEDWRRQRAAATAAGGTAEFLGFHESVVDIAAAIPI